MPAIKLIIFDFDEVILNDSLTLLTARLAGKEEEAKALVKELIESGEEDLQRKSRQLKKILFDGLKLIEGQSVEEIFNNAIAGGLVPGIVSVLKRLHGSYMLWILTTDEQSLVRRILDHFDLSESIVHVKGLKVKTADGRIVPEFEDSEILDKTKGGILRELIGGYGIERENILVIGDGLTDFSMFDVAENVILVKPWMWFNFAKRLFAPKIYLEGYVWKGIDRSGKRIREIRKDQISKIPQFIKNLETQK